METAIASEAPESMLGTVVHANLKGNWIYFYLKSIKAIENTQYYSNGTFEGVLNASFCGIPPGHHICVYHSRKTDQTRTIINIRWASAETVSRLSLQEEPWYRCKDSQVFHAFRNVAMVFADPLLLFPGYYIPGDNLVSQIRDERDSSWKQKLAEATQKRLTQSLQQVPKPATKYTCTHVNKRGGKICSRPRRPINKWCDYHLRYELSKIRQEDAKLRRSPRRPVSPIDLCE